VRLDVMNNQQRSSKYNPLPGHSNFAVTRALASPWHPRTVRIDHPVGQQCLNKIRRFNAQFADGHAAIEEARNFIFSMSRASTAPLG
jgi:prepilin-type processing-associated H-X9-DG protein